MSEGRATINGPTEPITFTLAAPGYDFRTFKLDAEAIQTMDDVRRVLAAMRLIFCGSEMVEQFGLHHLVTEQKQ